MAQSSTLPAYFKTFLRTQAFDCGFTIQSADNLFIRMPDGELIPVSASRIYGAVEPWADENFRKAFVLLNFLARPPLTDDEIVTMPNSDVIDLYYSLMQISGCRRLMNPLVSASLGNLAVHHERNLQRRIYSLRPDLWLAQYEGRTYRILIPPDTFKVPKCSDDIGLGMSVGGIVASIVAYAVPIVGWIYAAAQIAYTTYDTIQKNAEASKMQGLADELLNGIAIAKATFQDPPVSMDRINRLGMAYEVWQRTIASVLPNAYTININATHICNVETAILTATGGVPKYVARWQPYRKYFWSDAVMNLVFPVATQTSEAAVTPAAETSPAAAGWALGALLLLL